MTRIGIIGTGFGGLAVAVELTRAGHDDIRLWERAADLGGVWRDNTYPGAGCDVPSPLYSFSFAPNPDWSRRYALQPEIHAYIRKVADSEGITPLVQFGKEVVAAAWDDAWTVTFADGSSEVVDVLVSAVGQLSRPVLPPIPGIADFAGESFHSAQWSPDFDASGKRVAVVGIGASAVQLIPHLAAQAAELVVFQRSANYILPKPDMPYPSLRTALFHRAPVTLRAERQGIWSVMEVFARGLTAGSRVGRLGDALAARHLRKQVADPALRAKLTPDYPIGCKRILFSNELYPALAQPNVEVVTDAITRITPTAIEVGERTVDVDAIVFATGFDAQDFLASIDVTGEGGRKLAAEWVDGAHAYLGMYVPHFPNLFLSYGPNTNLGGGSIIYMLEAQARHMRQVIDTMRACDLGVVEPTEAAEKDYDDEIQTLLDSSVWGGCESWYRHRSGRITSNWPGATLPFAKRTRTLDPTAFTWA